MKGKEKFCMYAKKAMVPVLAIAMVLTATLLPIGAGSSDMYAYADDEATIKLSLEEGSVDSLNDTFKLSVNLTGVPKDGISAVQFELDYPSDVFKLEAKDFHLMGDDSIGFKGEENSDPYYIAFGSMDEEAAGVYKDEEGGTLAQFSFKPADTATGSSLNGTFEFELKNVKVIRLTEKDGLVVSENVDFSEDEANLKCTYTTTADNHFGDVASGSGSITVVQPKTSGGTGTTPTTEIPVVKTSTVRTAIDQAKTSESSTVTLDASDDTNGSNSIALTKTAAAEIATAGKSMTVKTQASDLTFDQDATASIGDKAGGEKLVIKTSKDTTSTENALKYTVTAKLVGVNDASDNETEVKYFGGGNVEVSLDLPSTWTAEERSALKCWNYTDTNYTEVKGGKVVEVTNGTEKSYKYEFTTNHFSHYMVASENTFNSFKGSRTEGVTVSGTAVSWNNTDDAVYKLYDSTVEDATIKAEWNADTCTNALSYVATKGNIEDTDVDGKAMKSQSFSFSGIPNGTYKLAIFKPGKYVPKIVEFTVNGSAYTFGQVKLWLYGDVNYDGRRNGQDATQIQRYVLKLRTLSADELLAADVNQDGKRNGQDATQIKRYVIKASSSFDNLK